ncbi:NAD-P-binding protein [Gymnopus androsaceus JB14]|uniref:NAD-P-binding protein n=1 Tax=Gymnopus androsaceus JB14 TaxID=1447944 RepID=A0A6A4GZF2_9AGAR|nr:NAD-P-binding protein [Gymnopus androsaceus JB14]
MSFEIKDLPVTVARHDVYEAISPEPYFSGSSFRGKIVVVVGASKGIGYSIASFYARAGATVVIVSRSQKTLDEARDRIVSESRTSSDVLALAADTADTKAIEEVIGKVVEKYGRLDVVVANSGVSSPWMKRFSEQDPYEDWWRVMEVNLRGAYNVAHYVLPHLTKSKGYFIAVTGMAAQINIPFASAYTVSKVALNRFIEYAAIGKSCSYYCYSLESDASNHTEHPEVKSFSLHPGAIKTEGSLGLESGMESFLIDTLQLPAATALKLTDGSGRFDWLSGRFVSANWDLEEVERDWKKDIVNKDFLKTRFIIE